MILVVSIQSPSPSWFSLYFTPYYCGYPKTIPYKVYDPCFFLSLGVFHIDFEYSLSENLNIFLPTLYFKSFYLSSVGPGIVQVSVLYRATLHVKLIIFEWCIDEFFYRMAFFLFFWSYVIAPSPWNCSPMAFANLIKSVY